MTIIFASFHAYLTANNTDTSKTTTTNSSSQKMNNLHLDELISNHTTITNGKLGYWEVKYDGRQLLIITDEHHNRLRIITPIIEVNKLKKGDYLKLLSANFDKALDAKYALYNEILWSVFTHPLGELTDDQFLDALKQVKTLADNYGSTYTSSDLTFGGGQ